MKQLTSAPKAARLRDIATGLRPIRRAALDGRDLAPFDDVLVDPAPAPEAGWRHAECFVLEDGPGTEGVVAVRRAAYADGREIHYDGGPRYALRIAWVATRGDGTEGLAQALVARVLLEIGGERLFLVDVSSERTARVFEALGFTRVARNGRWTRYAYLLREDRPQPLRAPQTDRTREAYLRRLSDEERQYHDALRERKGLDILALVTQGWTTYRGWRSSFGFAVTFGTTDSPRQTAFKVDVFDLADGAHVGYADTIVPGEGDTALGDVAVSDFPSAIPEGAPSPLEGARALDGTEADEHRVGWPTREGIWVRQDYRRAGIGKALERVVGDVCKLAFPGIRQISVTLPIGNSKATEFHEKAGAELGPDGVSSMVYPLDAPIRPGVAILHGL